MTATERLPDSAARFPGAGPSVTDAAGFDRGTGTGEPTEEIAHLLRLMKSADDGYNARDYEFFVDNCHGHDVVVTQIGSPITVGLPPHRADMDFWIGAFPDMKVHNDPYDIQFGQGQWTVAIGKLSGTFTEALTMPDGTVHPPTGKSFTTFFTTLARWQNEQMSDEYVLFDPQEIMKQIVVGR